MSVAAGSKTHKPSTRPGNLVHCETASVKDPVSIICLSGHLKTMKKRATKFSYTHFVLELFFTDTNQTIL